MVGAVIRGQLGRDLRQRDDAVRVADGRGAEGERAVPDQQRLVQHLARRPGHGDLVAGKAHRAHRDGDAMAALDLRLDHPAGRLDREVRGFHQALVPEEAGEDAQAVAALLRLGAVGIENAQAEIGLLRRHRPPEDAVGAEAEVAVADHADLPGLRRLPLGIIAGIEHQVVVAQGVVLVEAHDRGSTDERAAAGIKENLRPAAPAAEGLTGPLFGRDRRRGRRRRAAEERPRLDRLHHRLRHRLLPGWIAGLDLGQHVAGDDVQGRRD